MISTRGRYALRVMIDLAEHAHGSFIPMKEVAQRQQISLKYLEQIIPDLTKAGLLEGMHGKGGGYRLRKDPAACRVGDVLRITEGELAPVACLACNAGVCVRASQCRTLPMWQKYNELTRNFFDSITILDLMNGSVI